MEYPWRPSGNICPVCARSHIPFCPPLPPQYFRPPPPPPDQFYHTPPPPQPSYDPFVDHQAAPTITPYPPPAPVYIPHRPWNANPDFGRKYYANSNPGLDYDNNSNGQIGVKRMRFNDVSGSYIGLSEDERRLKLIRDHGVTGHGLDRKYDGGYRVANHSSRPSNFGDKSESLGYLREMDSDMKQNYGEHQVQYQHVENNHESDVVRNQGYGNSVPGADMNSNFKRPRGNLETSAYDDATYQGQRRSFSTDSREFSNQFLQSHATQHRMEPKSAYYSPYNQSDNARLLQDPPGLKAQPPLPTSPPPPLPVEQTRLRSSESMVPSSGPGSLFPVAVGSGSSFQSPYTTVSESMPSVSSHYTNKVNQNSRGYYPEETQAAQNASSRTLNGETDGFHSRSHSLDKPKVIDASHILKHPHRANRPDHIVIILRGLPGSGKSYLAKILRDLEVENGGTAPRIHSMDEYFMTEVEKVESEGSRSSGSGRGKKPVMKKVMEYCYEPEMEEAYRSSMLKAFRKTLDEGTFPFVIVDDRNLRVADFAHFWATAKRSGYEVYILEASYKDPAGCAARNVHGFTQSDIHKMANQWEEAPSLYMKLDVKSLLHGDALEQNGIEEVDMDTEDGNYGGDPSWSDDSNVKNVPRPESDLVCDGPGPLIDEKGYGAEEPPVEVVKELGKSKWSNDLDEDDVNRTEVTRGNSGAFSSSVKSYSKKGKSVRWGDQIGRVGFSIGAGKSANVSLVIGPGSGYNLRSNPLPEEEKLTRRYTGESTRQNIFQEQLQAERESFRAVFDKRKQRIRGLDADEE